MRTENSLGKLWVSLGVSLGILLGPLTAKAAVNVCSEGKDAAQVARTAYNGSDSDKKKYLPSGFTLVKTWSSTKYGGGDHAYLSTTTSSGKTVCHYAFRGLKTSKVNFLKLLKNMHTHTTCKTESGTKMGSCSKEAYNRYSTLRSSILSDIKSRSCTGGIRVYGHSMGGALASLLAAELYLLNSSTYGKSKAFLRTYTFGSPRVFKGSDANTWNDRVWLARWVYEGTDRFSDHAPSYPGSSYKFSHFGQAYRVKKTVKWFKAKYSYNTQSQNWAPSSISLTDHEASVYTTNMNKLKCK
ncbi:MAG: hypothetical protein H6727_19160 [Myxococcales bacterium]|nr:hypothetical protein [Myxococcales bacterium]